jgi:hypothetical protein
MRLFGVTADARLTIHDSTHEQPAVVCLRSFQLTDMEIDMIIKGLQHLSTQLDKPQA